MVNWFDLTIVVMCMAANAYFFVKRETIRLHWLIVTIFIVGFVAVLPVVSMDIEYSLLPLSSKEGVHDGYEFVFLFLKFPMYWVAVVCLWIIYLAIKGKLRMDSPSNNP
jgi:hypothetical protein